MAVDTRRLHDTMKFARDRRRQYALDLRGETNPQLVASRLKAEAEAETLQAVLEALGGDFVQLDIMAHPRF